jgi:hypothetical protein
MITCKDLALRNMVVKRRRRRAVDRTEWASVVKEVEAKLKGLQ